MRYWWSSARGETRYWLRRLGENGPRERKRELAFWDAIDPLIATVTANLESQEAYDAAYSVTGEAEEWLDRVLIASEVWGLWMNLADCVEVPQPHGVPDEAKVRDGMAMVAREWLTVAPGDRRGFLTSLEANSAWWDWLLNGTVAPAPPIDIRRVEPA